MLSVIGGYTGRNPLRLRHMVSFVYAGRTWSTLGVLLVGANPNFWVLDPI